MLRSRLNPRRTAPVHAALLRRGEPLFGRAGACPDAETGPGLGSGPDVPGSATTAIHGDYRDIPDLVDSDFTAERPQVAGQDITS
jgi:hypothetical protein